MKERLKAKKMYVMSPANTRLALWRTKVCDSEFFHDDLPGIKSIVTIIANC